MQPTPENSSRRSSRWLIAAIVLATLIALAWYPVYSHLRAVAVLLRIESAEAHGFFADRGMHPIATQETTLAGGAHALRARFYVPTDESHAPVLMILHGVHHLGYNEPRLVRFAKAMAGAGLVVATPNLPELADYEITPVSVEEIGNAANDLAARMNTPCVGVLGLSFAGGLALEAASDPAYGQHICYVVAVGAHDDMARVMKFFGTDEAVYPDGKVEPMQAHEYGVLVAIYAHPEEYFSAQDVPVAREAIRALLYEEVGKSKELAQALSAAGQKRMADLIAQNQTAEKPILLANLEKHRAEMDAVSPAATLYRIHVPVMLLHGAGDNVIPPSETLWLAKDIPASRLKAVLISPAISHVEVGKGATMMDKWRLVHFIQRLLAEAKDAPYNTVDLSHLAGSAALAH